MLPPPLLGCSGKQKWVGGKGESLERGRGAGRQTALLVWRPFPPSLSYFSCGTAVAGQEASLSLLAVYVLQLPRMHGVGCSSTWGGGGGVSMGRRKKEEERKSFRKSWKEELLLTVWGQRV